MQEVQIDPRMGSKPVRRVNAADVEALADSMLSSGLKQKSVRNVLTFLHTVFEHALERGWVNENPVRHAAKPKRQRGKSKPRPPVPDDDRARRPNQSGHAG